MKNKVDYTKVGNRIRIERENFDISREKFAELLDLSPYFIGQIERGERKMSISTLINVSQYLHVSIDYLIFGKKTLILIVLMSCICYLMDVQKRKLRRL